MSKHQSYYNGKGYPWEYKIRKTSKYGKYLILGKNFDYIRITGPNNISFHYKIKSL